MGDKSSPIPPVYPQKAPKWKTLFAVLKQKTLILYTDETQVECVQVIPVAQYQVQLLPENTNDMEMFNRHNPIYLLAKEDGFSKPSIEYFYIYCPTGSEKEDWFLILRRVSQLPAFADNDALSAFYQELAPMKSYVGAMEKLIEKTKDDDPSNVQIHWLNALVGRLFVAVHTSIYVKEWLTARLSVRSPEREEEGSFLGDIVIQDLDPGDSIPVISNPKLLSISVNGDLMVELDIDYTGGFRVEAATVANLSVPAWDAYMKPITVPIVVAIKINHFAARVLLKIKPFWESNRVWFGFYHKPELKLELQVEPIISNKLIKLQLVNQVIERRIKEALEEYVMLPNMDNFSFW
ncbi:putative integral membrane protein conserved region-domain-containing protein, partial [Gorgonomyces haynaldii]